VRSRERTSSDDFRLSEFSDDTHSLLFGTDEIDDSPYQRMTRADRRRLERSHHVRRRWRGRIAVVAVIVIVAVVAVIAVPRLIDLFSVKDYSGSGFGSVQVTIPSGASASDIGAILQKDGVVESTQAFTDAASADSRSTSIQPGTYQLRKHMSGKSALALLLDPSSRDKSADVAVPEGATSIAVRERLIRMYGNAKSGEIDSALAHPRALGVPSNYTTSSGKAPSSVEGFLYPATYTPDPGDTPAQTLQAMVTRFISQDRTMSFAGAAKQAGITPYQALIIASIAQSEAKYPQDMSKVTRTIRNRLKAGIPLQSDATSAYGCRLKQITHCIYNQVDSPYNSYKHDGLPPTPIDNPGAPAMHAAVHPASGNWLYFVTIDKAGHLGFFHSAAKFQKAAERCAKYNWGCAG